MPKEKAPAELRVALNARHTPESLREQFAKAGFPMVGVGDQGWVISRNGAAIMGLPMVDCGLAGQPGVTVDWNQGVAIFTQAAQ